MLKTTLAYVIVFATLAYGVKVYAAAVALHDDHVFMVARCMSRTVKALDISSQEAYLLCEKEER